MLADESLPSADQFASFVIRQAVELLVKVFVALEAAEYQSCCCFDRDHDSGMQAPMPNDPKLSDDGRLARRLRKQPA